MKFKKHILSSLLLVVLVINSTAQEKQSWALDHVNFTGYVKYLNTSNFISLDSIGNDNLIHNRLNLKVYANNNFTFAVELRNRIIWGSSVESIPNYSSIVKNPQDIHMSVWLINKPALIMLSTIDRLYMDYHTNKWQFVLGRQRINWGKNLVWNPNDLFNAYSFFNFDYEERPGTDAVRVKYFTSGNSSMEFALNYADDWKDNKVALKYNFNKFQYDFQMIAAKYLENYTLGLGWEGVIKDVGFKGELSYFMPYSNSEEENDFVASTSFDYYFKNDISINVSALYNSVGMGGANSYNGSQLYSGTIDVKHLMPNKWSFFGQVSKTFTPAISTSAASIYAADINMVFFMPQFTYSISENWDFDITGQVFYGKQVNKFSNLGNSIYLRFRYSF